MHTVGTMYCSGVRFMYYYAESLSIRKRGGHFRLTMVLSSCHVRTKRQRGVATSFRPGCVNSPPISLSNLHNPSGTFFAQSYGQWQPCEASTILLPVTHVRIDLNHRVYIVNQRGGDKTLSLLLLKFVH